MRRGVRLAACAGVAGSAWLAACSNSVPTCSAPATGSFSIALQYTESLSADIYCDAAAPDAAPVCSDGTHALDGQTLVVSVTGSAATVKGPSGLSWSCAATAPQAAPGSAPDASDQAGTGCYLLVTCAGQTLGDAGVVDTQIQIFPRSASGDALVLLRHESGGCCSDQYAGNWQ